MAADGRDLIEHPEHYTGRGGIEPTVFIMSNDMSFLEGNIVKYVYRYPFKGGVQDLLKARRYLNWLIEREQGRQSALGGPVLGAQAPDAVHD